MQILEIRNRLVKVRKELGKKQRDIAKLCGVEQQTYSHWERGRSTPSLQKIIILEKIFSVSKEELFFDVFDSGDEFNETSAANKYS